VMRAHPSKPPLGVASLLRILSKHYTVFTSTHTHSSVDKPGSLVLGESRDVSRGSAEIRISLIYTDVKDATLIAGPATILGEGSILRYLARLLDMRTRNGLYESLEANTVNTVDAVLDRLVDGSKHNVNIVVSGLLAKQQFLAAADQPTLADLLAISMCEQHGITSPAIKAWTKAVTKYIESC